MASSVTSRAAGGAESYTNMAGDVDAVGAHCQMQYCNMLDFLPFRCESCRGTYCLDHRTETAHKCPKEGEWARRRNNLNIAANNKLPSKPSLYNHDRQCADPSCKTLIYTSLTTGVHCQRCNRHYCLKHRMEEEHDCKNLKPIGAQQKTAAQRLQQQRERSLTALGKLKKWADDKMEEERKNQQKKGLFGLGSKSGNAAREAQQALVELKKQAKGDAKVPSDKRIYLHVEASADTTKAKYPTGKFFYHKDWTVGRVLDMAAKSLQVQNVNNRSEKEEDKLRVFHVQGGRLLKFSEKIGDPCVSGNMIVLLRGVGSGEVEPTDLMN